ncbi:hypothetical protein LguiB_002898 [Lonicera macranthoides]
MATASAIEPPLVHCPSSSFHSICYALVLPPSQCFSFFLHLSIISSAAVYSFLLRNTIVPPPSGGPLLYLLHPLQPAPENKSGILEGNKINSEKERRAHENKSKKGIWGGGENGILTAVAEAPGPANDAPASTLVLAEKRTKRPDILDNFCRYQGGWDIANKHYCVTEAAMIVGAREAGVSPIVGSFPQKEAALVKVDRCRLRASKVVDLGELYMLKRSLSSKLIFLYLHGEGAKVQVIGNVR